MGSSGPPRLATARGRDVSRRRSQILASASRSASRPVPGSRMKQSASARSRAFVVRLPFFHTQAELGGQGIHVQSQINGMKLPASFLTQIFEVNHVNLTCLVSTFTVFWPSKMSSSHENGSEVEGGRGSWANTTCGGKRHTGKALLPTKMPRHAFSPQVNSTRLMHAR